MCAIAGIVKRDPRAVVEPARLRAMATLMRHRGPDDEGLWTGGPAGLAHRRLAIVDVAGGRQPMSNANDRLHLVFNGEIYNHAALRPGLENKGHRFRTRSDTEVILHLYEEEGEAAVERLRGMFAFALWDADRARLFLARDRLGIKPLYYALNDDELIFASEIKALFAAGISPQLDSDVLPEFLANRFVAGEQTFFARVRKLEPGHTLLWSAGSVERRHYWRPPTGSNGHHPSFAASATRVRDHLHEAVQSHLMSDVPLGVFLSGGIDSSGLAAIMASMVREPIRTFSVGFTDATANELPFARLAAQQIHAEHREVVVSPQDFFTALPRLIWHEDEPIAFTSSVPLYFVSALARRHVKVVLTGEGADELFLGYNRYRISYWNERLGRLLPMPQAARRTLSRLAAALPLPARRLAARSFLTQAESPRQLYFDNFAVFPQQMQPALFAKPERFADGDPYRKALRLFDEASGDCRERLSAADLQTYLVELLMKQDQMSMAASVESRVPFLDHPFVEAVSSIPAEHKLSGLGTKRVLRRALKDLVPRPILTRRKMGFPVPLGKWLRNGFSPVLDDLVLSPRARARGHFNSEALTALVAEHRNGQANHAERLWLLINFELWQRIFFDGESPEDLSQSIRNTCASSG